MGYHRIPAARLNLHLKKIALLWCPEHFEEGTDHGREQTSQQPCVVNQAEEVKRHSGGNVEEWTG